MYAQPETWSQLMLTGMQQDWSWERSARQYIDLYQRTLERVRAGVCT